jgi:hypothetical protein
MNTRLWSIALVTGLSRPAHAQWNAARFDDARRVAAVSVGVDPAVLATAAYGQRARIGGPAVRFGVEGSVAAGNADVRDFRLRLNAETVLLRWQSVRATGRLGFVTHGTTNTVHHAFGFGADAGGALGLYRSHWFAAGEATFDKAIVTHLAHTAQYRADFAGAQDGWYLATGGTWRVGGLLGTSFGRNEIVVRAGVPRTQGGEPLLVPAYATLGVGRSF